MNSVQLLLQKHTRLLQHLDERFRTIQSMHAEQMQCGRGCAQCCHGLFDVSLPDAVRIVDAFAVLSQEKRSWVIPSASAIQERIQKEAAELQEPYFLNALSPERIDQIVESVPDVRCPFLDDADSCLIYAHRPLACRLEGIPMVDSRDGLFGDWCELNFRGGVSAELAEDLRMDYYEVQAIEHEVTGRLSQILLGSRQDEATAFIPSILLHILNYGDGLLNSQFRSRG